MLYVQTHYMNPDRERIKWNEEAVTKDGMTLTDYNYDDEERLVLHVNKGDNGVELSSFAYDTMDNQLYKTTTISGISKTK